MTTNAALTRPTTLSTPRRIGVMIADDHHAVRRGVRALIADQPDMSVVAHATTEQDAMATLSSQVDVLIVDYHLGADNGLDVIRRLRARPERPRTLVYSAFANEALAVGAVIAGADGLLNKATVDLELCTAVRRLAGGQTYLPTLAPSVTHLLADRLEPTQLRLFELFRRGVENAEIGALIDLSPRDLDEQRAAMLRQLNGAALNGRLTPARHAPLSYGRGLR